MIKIETNAGRTTAQMHGAVDDVVSDAAVIAHRLYTALLREPLAAEYFQEVVRNADYVWTDDRDNRRETSYEVVVPVPDADAGK